MLQTTLVRRAACGMKPTCLPRGGLGGAWRCRLSRPLKREMLRGTWKDLVTLVVARETTPALITTTTVLRFAPGTALHSMRVVAGLLRSGLAEEAASASELVGVRTLPSRTAA